MSTIRYICPRCRVTVQANAVIDEQNRRRADCPRCGNTVVIRRPVSEATTLETSDASHEADSIREGIQAGESVSGRPRISGPLEDASDGGEDSTSTGGNRRAKKRDRKTPWFLFVGVTVGAILLIVAAVVGGALLWYRAAYSDLKDDRRAQSQTTPPKDNAPAPPPAHPNEQVPLNIPGVQNQVAWNAVPQESPEKAKARRKAKREWVKATTLDAYEKVGRRSPKWDEPARESFRALVRLWNGNTQGGGHDRVACWKAADRAVKAGCDDPLLKYLHVRMAYLPRFATLEERARELELAADALAKSDYPAVRKAHAHYNAAAYMTILPLTAKGKAAVERRVSATLNLIPEILKDKHPEARNQALELCESIIQLHNPALGDRKKTIDRVTAVLEGDPAWRPLLLSVRGAGYIKYAWDARGSGPATAVTPEGWRLFRERLEQAEKDLTTAWEMDNSMYKAANGMITVAIGQGWDHERMEVWFERAMEANSDNLDACSRKLQYLQPRWYGSWQEMLAFGRKCRDTKNWEGGLPFILAIAHFELGGRMENSPYFRQRGVWEEIQPLYESYLKMHPESGYYRAMYALWAYRCGRYQEAEQLFQQMGDDDWVDVFASAAQYQQVVADTHRRVNEGG